MSLVDGHFSTLTHVKPPLLRMDVGLRRDPRRRVERVAQGVRGERAPLDAQRDRVLAGSSQFSLCYTCRRQRNNSLGPRLAGTAPLVEVDVVRIQVIGDVRRLAGPGLRCFFCSCLCVSLKRHRRAASYSAARRRRRDPHKRTPIKTLNVSSWCFGCDM